MLLYFYMIIVMSDIVDYMISWFIYFHIYLSIRIFYYHLWYGQIFYYHIIMVRRGFNLLFPGMVRKVQYFTYIYVKEATSLLFCLCLLWDFLELSLFTCYHIYVIIYVFLYVFIYVFMDVFIHGCIYFWCFRWRRYGHKTITTVS